MKSHFDLKFFRGNRARLQKLFAGKAPIVITANGLLQRSGDTTFPFRQDSSFWYLTGINVPDFILVMDKDEDYLIAPFRSESQNIMEGQLNLQPLIKRSGITKILDSKTGWKKLNSRLKKVKHIATLSTLPEYIESYGFYTNPARTALVGRIKDANSHIKLLDLKSHLVRMRSLKQRAELAVMQEAIDITAGALKNIKTNLSKYEFEYEIEAELSHQFIRKGSSGHAFTPIVAAGANASIIHYTAKSASLKGNSFVLIDTGAEAENYAADISRTYQIKTPSKREQAVYNAVRDVFNYAISLLKPGLLSKNYEKAIEHYMGEKLRELGLIKTINRENVRKYYPHSTSHFLGLDVHDAGNYDELLLPNMVITVEPGIYLPKEGIGVRIEDDILITKNGHENLSKAAPYL